MRYGVDVFGAKDQLEGLAQLTVEGNVEYDQINVRIQRTCEREWGNIQYRG